MPVLMRYPNDNVKVTLSATPGIVTAVVLAVGTQVVTMQPITNDARFSWDEADQAAMSVHDLPLLADTDNTVRDLSRVGNTGLQRSSATHTVASQPSDGELWYYTVGGTTVRFEFDGGGGVAAGSTAIVIGGTTALTATAIAAALSASALSCEADVNPRDDTQVDVVTKTKVPISIQSSATVRAKVVDVVYDFNRIVVYLASAQVSPVVRIETEG